ncbi:MAG: (cytosine-5)-methyltransferase 1 [Blastocatellia bacterium]|jgi:DNA (cytosine-5)-methyltransferase 1|nr:(cytosine-5)-methyltransferase 1 [Blastocatellia bacterium]
MPKPKAIDLFSGCGGLTLGLKQAGFRVVGAIEIDSLAVKTYKANHKRVTVWERDISKVPAAEVMRKLNLVRGELDLLAGCPPCQGFSTMRTLNGKRTVNDPRNNLLSEFMRFVRLLRPKAIMMENVPALARDRRLKRALIDLNGMGYECSTAILNAANFAVPQRRRRFILVAGRRSKIPEKIPFAREARCKPNVRRAFGQLGKRAKNDPLHNYKEKRTHKVKDMIRLIPPNGGSRFALGKRAQLRCHKNFDGFKDVYGRMSWDHVAPTITTGCFNPSKGRFLHPTKHRAVTLREAALLQTFPKSYFFSLERGRILAAEMIGNALPPEFIKRHAIKIIESLELSDG